MTPKETAIAIRKGEVDCNDQQLFFATLLKGLMVDLKSIIKIRGISVPHAVINTGDDTIWILEKDYNAKKEPLENTNEQYIYNIVPRCVVTLGGIDMVPDQLTNPYSRGTFQYDDGEQLLTFNAEVRRMPIKCNVTLKYILDSFTDALEMIQHACTKLAFIRKFNIVYMGQTIGCTYKIPEAFEDQHMAEIQGDTREDRNRTIELQLELESNIPVFSAPTVVENKIIVHPKYNLSANGHEIASSDDAPRKGPRTFGSR